MATKTTAKYPRVSDRDPRFKLLGVCRWSSKEATIQDSEHGTTKRYNQAVRVGAEACDKCKTANTQRDLEYRRRRRVAEAKAEAAKKKAKK